MKNVRTNNKSYPTELVSKEQTMKNNYKRIRSSVQESKIEIQKFFNNIEDKNSVENIQIMIGESSNYVLNNDCSNFSNLFRWRMEEKQISGKKDYIYLISKSTYITGMFSLTENNINLNRCFRNLFREENQNNVNKLCRSIM